MIDCALISADDTFRRLVRRLMQHPEARARLVVDIQRSTADVPRDAVARILNEGVRLVFVDLDETLTGLRVLDAFTQDAPGIVLIAAGPQLPADALLQVIRAGASEYLPRPLSDEEVRTSFQRVSRRLGSSSRENEAFAAPISTFFSGKGGTGVTTLAVNAAVALSELTQEETLLVDLAEFQGTASLHLGLHPRYSYLDVAQNFHRIDQELLRSFLDADGRGVSVLSSPPLSEQEGRLTTDQVLSLLRFCQRYFGNIVVDAGNYVTDAGLAAMMESDHRLLVATADLPALRNVRRTLDFFRRQNGKKPPRVILNRWDADAGLSMSDVEEALGHSVRYVIDRDDPTLLESINVGRPAVMERRSRFTKGVRALATELAGPDRIVKEDQGLLDALLRPFRKGTASTKEAS